MPASRGPSATAELLVLVQLLLFVDFRMPNLEIPTSERTLVSLVNEYIDPWLTWDTVTWLKSITSLPVVVKGILAG